MKPIKWYNRIDLFKKVYHANYLYSVSNGFVDAGFLPTVRLVSPI